MGLLAVQKSIFGVEIQKLAAVGNPKHPREDAAATHTLAPLATRLDGRISMFHLFLFLLTRACMNSNANSHGKRKCI